MRDVIGGIEQEYARYRALGRATLDQLSEEQLRSRPNAESNSVATLVWHVAGNLESRFTDFLSTDGEKPWRERDDEFAVREVSRAALDAKWSRGWDVVAATLADLTDMDLGRTVTIRGVDFTVAGALERSLAHTAYHVGQIVFIGKMLSGPGWTWLTIPPGGTAEYNRDPKLERGPSPT